MIPLQRVAGLVYNRPLLITPQAAQTISDVVQAHIMARMNGEPHPVAGGRGVPRASSFIGDYVKTENGMSVAPYRMKDGTAIIEIVGELVNRGAWIGADSGMVSYEGLTHQLTMAARDSRVQGILLDIESPGGEAVGAFELAATVRNVAKEKPVVAFVNGMAASGGYAIASGASRRVSVPSGLSGSIGVVMMHVDMSHALHNRGLKPTFIFAGKHKVDGNAFEPLPDEVRERFQKEVDQFYGMFVDAVSAGTGLSAEAIRATEAQMYMGDDAKGIGLVDAIGTFDDAMSEVQSISRGARASRTSMRPRMAAEESEMSLMEKIKAILASEPEAETPEPTPAAETPETPTVDAAAVVAERDALLVEAETLRAKLAESEASVKADRTARINAEVKSFMDSYGVKMGADLHGTFEKAYRAAKEADNAERIAELEAIAKALHPAMAEERIPAGGASVDAAVARAAGDVARDPDKERDEKITARMKADGVSYVDARNRVVADEREAANAA